MTGNESAHAAQYAAGASLDADCRPSPPKAAGNKATARARRVASVVSEAPPSSSNNVAHMAASCAWA